MEHEFNYILSFEYAGKTIFVNDMHFYLLRERPEFGKERHGHRLVDTWNLPFSLMIASHVGSILFESLRARENPLKEQQLRVKVNSVLKVKGGGIAGYEEYDSWLLVVIERQTDPEDANTWYNTRLYFNYKAAEEDEMLAYTLLASIISDLNDYAEDLFFDSAPGADVIGRIWDRRDSTKRGFNDANGKV